MTAVDFNQQQIKFCDFPQIHLDDIDERCGEVYITLSGTLVFHCSLCSSNYGSVDNFLGHLSKEHFKDIKDEDENKSIAKRGRGDSETLLEDYIIEEKFITDVHGDGDLKEDVEGDGDLEDDAVEDDDVEDDAVNDVEDDVKYDVQDDDYDDDDDDLAVNDDDIDAYEEMLQNKEVAGSYRTNFEIKEMNLKKQTFNLEKKNRGSKSKRPYGRRSTFGPFICRQCNKNFLSNVSLKRHSLIHSDIRKHQCEICGFAFKDPSNLESHVRRHLGTNKIECGFCPKTFFTQTEVNSHRRVHTGERPHPCSICDKAFTTANRLKMHLKRHTSEPTYKCDYCHKGFYERSRYEDHKLVHTKQKRFVCEICAAAFPRLKSWARHAKLHENSTREVKRRQYKQ